MSEQIITKCCPKCKEIKPVSEFSKHSKMRDGLQSQCKACVSETQKNYYRTEKGKETNRRASRKYHQTARGKALDRRYRQSEEGKVAQKRHYQSERGTTTRKHYRQTEKGKNTYRRGIRKYRQNHPERIKAGSAVSIAIHNGGIPHPSTLQCSLCPAQAQEYHHPRYEPEHWLDVVPVCIPCHKKYLLVLKKS